MISISTLSRQPPRAAWTLDHLNYEQSILLELSIDSTTAATYSSATNSYLTFCKKHQLSMEPMAETLSYYITYQTHFISPDSIDSGSSISLSHTIWIYGCSWPTMDHAQIHQCAWLSLPSLPPTLVAKWWFDSHSHWWFFPDSNLAGQSMWAGGATALAEAGAVPDLIMGSGWWTLVAWTSYMWKNPILLHALLLTWMTHFQPLAFAWTSILSSAYVSPVLYHLCLLHFFFLLSTFLLIHRKF